MRQVNTIVVFVSIVIAVTATASTTQGATLIGHWGFEEGTGSTALDSTANNLDGAISNATYTAGKVGQYALDFNGSNAFVEIQNSALLVPNTIGIAMWFKAGTSQVTSADLLDKGHGLGSTPYYAGYVFQYEGSSSSIGTIYGTGSDFAQASTGLGYKDDVWHHIVANL
ncbi:MAG: hypothetical protein GY801_34525, partial [bacterium]|nr:hypothetical protein [bacterium]